VDSARSYCEWRQDNGHCKYADASFDMDAVVIVSIVVSILTAPINFVVDCLFVDVLAAQSIDESKVSRVAKSRLNRKFFSQFSGSEGTLFNRKPIVPSAPINRDPLDRVQTSAFNRHTVKIPTETSSAQSMALELASGLLGEAQRRLQMLNEFRDQSRSKHLVERQRQNLVRKQTVVDHSHTPSGKRQSKNGSHHSAREDDDDLLTKFSSFVVDLSDQRKALKPNKRDRFDARWGVDPTGEFSRHWTALGEINNAEILRDEMRFVRKETRRKVAKLEVASDSHIGVELMHLFMLDVLGRETPAAKIFLTKSQQDFSHSYVLPQSAKILAWILVVLLNLFFVYFSLLRAMQRGYSWQVLYAMSCLLQFLVEIFFYETSETLLLHFLVPDLVRVEVQSATFTLLKAIDQMCRQDCPAVLLNAPQYFFVSSNVANRFPHLLESVLIQSYRTYWPGELGKKWKFDQPTLLTTFFGFTTGGTAAVRSLTLSAVLTSILQQLGATAPAIQKLILHSAQPLLVSLFFMLGRVLTASPLYSLLFAPAIAYGLFVYLTREVDDDAKAKQMEIHPLPEQSEQPPPPTTAAAVSSTAVGSREEADSRHEEMLVALAGLESESADGPRSRFHSEEDVFQCEGRSSLDHRSLDPSSSSLSEEESCSCLDDISLDGDSFFVSPSASSSSSMLGIDSEPSLSDSISINPSSFLSSSLDSDPL
jgi:hypothetical protein